MFNKVRDADLLEWLDDQENQSKAVRMAIREMMNNANPVNVEISNDDILAEIKTLQAQIKNIKAVTNGAIDADPDEPEDIVDKLKGFGL